MSFVVGKNMERLVRHTLLYLDHEVVGTLRKAKTLTPRDMSMRHARHGVDGLPCSTGRILFHTHPKLSDTTDFPSINDILCTINSRCYCHIIFTHNGYFVLKKTGDIDHVSVARSISRMLSLDIPVFFARKVDESSVASRLGETFSGTDFVFSFCTW